MFKPNYIFLVHLFDVHTCQHIYAGINEMIFGYKYFSIKIKVISFQMELVNATAKLCLDSVEIKKITTYFVFFFFLSTTHYVFPFQMHLKSKCKKE